jgi:hypothetical protein
LDTPLRRRRSRTPAAAAGRRLIRPVLCASPRRSRGGSARPSPAGPESATTRSAWVIG